MSNTYGGICVQFIDFFTLFIYNNFERYKHQSASFV